MAIYDEKTSRYYCECGCGTSIPHYNRFVQGHSNRVQEVRDKISKSNTEHYESLDVRQMQSDIQTEVWQNAELRKKQSEIVCEAVNTPEEKLRRSERRHTEETKAQIGESNRETYKNPELRKQSKDTMDEYWSHPENRDKQSEVVIEAMSDPDFKLRHSKKMTEVYSNPELIERISSDRKEDWDDLDKRLRQSEAVSEALANRSAEEKEEHSRKQSEVGKKNWNNPDYVKMMCEARQIKPNNVESFLLECLEDMFPGEWRYTGDGGGNGKAAIGGRLPDFTHTSKKVIIESFGKYYHSIDPSDPKSEEGTIRHYGKHGYRCIVIWADDWMEIAEKFSDLVMRINATDL